MQERSLEIARGHLDHFYRVMVQNYTDFMKRYSQQHQQHNSLLVNFVRDVEKLRAIKVHPSLQTTTNRKCLLDFVKEDNLRKTVEDCCSSHTQFEKVSKFEQEVGDLKRNAEDLFSGKASFLVRDLDLTVKDHQHVINEQKNVNTVKKLVNDCISRKWSSSLRSHDAVSALGLMYDSHEKNCFPRMQE
ncbi:hypothetical protein SASPL_126883 [Salvia splendens]|uniref:Uncharacterized protein n=1 Tax=Salvia splendens TaxID=180675 RepID=A0A8X8XGG7_SALSN|nr:hypothetical protein SASPL_126883 [Salvia splendens]